MQYFLYIDGGDGCDYTIACNKVLRPLAAATRDGALAEARELLVGAGPDGGYYGEESVRGAKVTLLAAEVEDVPLESWFCDRDALAARAAAEDEARQNRSLYERLREEFGESVTNAHLQIRTS